MRAVWLLLLALSLVLTGNVTARAADSYQAAAGVGAACAEAARDCCHRITVACIELKYRPRCDWPAHKCATTLQPCAPEICLPRVCHKPLATRYPDAPCLDRCPACHKPAVTADPPDPCPVDPPLTGTPALIVEECPQD